MPRATIRRVIAQDPRRLWEMRLYQAEWCPFSHRVRAKLTELSIDYEAVNVSASAKKRAELEAPSRHQCHPSAGGRGEGHNRFGGGYFLPGAELRSGPRG